MFAIDKTRYTGVEWFKLGEKLFFLLLRSKIPNQLQRFCQKAAEKKYERLMGNEI